MMRASRTLSVPAIALGAYLAFLLMRYFYPPHIPRFRVESVFMWFVAAGAAGAAPGMMVDPDVVGTDRPHARRQSDDSRLRADLPAPRRD